MGRDVVDPLPVNPAPPPLAAVPQALDVLGFGSVSSALPPRGCAPGPPGRVSSFHSNPVRRRSVNRRADETWRARSSSSRRASSALSAGTAAAGAAARARAWRRQRGSASAEQPRAPARERRSARGRQRGRSPPASAGPAPARRTCSTGASLISCSLLPYGVSPQSGGAQHGPADRRSRRRAAFCRRRTSPASCPSRAASSAARRPLRAGTLTSEQQRRARRAADRRRVIPSRVPERAAGRASTEIHPGVSWLRCCGGARDDPARAGRARRLRHALHAYAFAANLLAVDIAAHDRVGPLVAARRDWRESSVASFHATPTIMPRPAQSALQPVEERRLADCTARTTMRGVVDDHVAVAAIVERALSPHRLRPAAANERSVVSRPGCSPRATAWSIELSSPVCSTPNTSSPTSREGEDGTRKVVTVRRIAVLKGRAAGCSAGQGNFALRVDVHRVCTSSRVPSGPLEEGRRPGASASRRRSRPLAGRLQRIRAVTTTCVGVSCASTRSSSMCSSPLQKDPRGCAAAGSLLGERARHAHEARARRARAGRPAPAAAAVRRAVWTRRACAGATARAGRPPAAGSAR